MVMVKRWGIKLESGEKIGELLFPGLNVFWPASNFLVEVIEEKLNKKGRPKYRGIILDFECKSHS